MIRKFEALSFRCLRHVSQSLDSFHVLVGPNASGKTTFLDAIAFLGDLLSLGLEGAVEQRTADLRDLIWQRKIERFELAVELRVPEEENDLFPDSEYGRCRYEVGVGPFPETGETALLSERVLLLPDGDGEVREGVQQSLFDVDRPVPETLASPRFRGTKTVVHKIPGGNDKFYDETGTGWDHSFKLGPRRSALANLPEDESRFPVATWLKRTLAEGIQRISLDSARMKRPSPPGQPRRFRPDGSNLPWAVASLEEQAPARLAEWVARIQTVLPEVETIRTVERPEDRHRYLVVRYRNGLEVPSWMVSEGTLRLLAFTLFVHLPDFEGIYLIEEPENGLHPCAVKAVYEALAAGGGAQIFLTTHSPVLLSLAEPSRVLCFSRAESGAVDLLPGAEHPALCDWQGAFPSGRFSARGVLG